MHQRERAVDQRARGGKTGAGERGDIFIGRGLRRTERVLRGEPRRRVGGVNQAVTHMLPGRTHPEIRLDVRHLDDAAADDAQFVMRTRQFELVDDVAEVIVAPDEPDR